MNMMTLQRYKNELIILVTLLFLIFAFIYKYSATLYVQENRAMNKEKIAQISTIVALKEQWGGKNISKSIKPLKSIVSNAKVVLFQKKSKKLVVSYKNLSGSELSKVTNKLINIPVQITRLEIKHNSKNLYTMEFTCKW